MVKGGIIHTYDVDVYLNGKKLARIDYAKLIVDTQTQVVQVEMKFTPTNVEWGEFPVLKGAEDGVFKGSDRYELRIELE